MYSNKGVTQNAPGDYGEEKRMIRLTIMNSLQCLTIRIINDTITENSENFMLLLSTTETRVKIAPATVTFNIIDDDQIKCQQEQTSSEQYGSYTWPVTYARKSVEIACVFKAGHYATRFCTTAGSWIAVDYSKCKIIVQAINLTLYVRFSSIIGNIVLNGNANEFLLTVQNVFSQEAYLYSIMCTQVALQLKDIQYQWNRTECVMTVSKTTDIQHKIFYFLQTNNFSIAGTEITSENGFCSYETTHEGTRGVFLWNETEVNSIASSKCFYGPSNVTVTRLCAKRGMPTDVTVELCRTAISDNFTVIKHVLQMNVTRATVTMAVNNLTVIVMATSEQSDQNSDNLAVVTFVIKQTAALLNQTAGNITLQTATNIVNNTVSILDSIEEWPEEVIEMNSNEILKAFEMITESLIQKDNFTFITVVTEDVALIGEKILREDFQGRSFSVATGNILKTSDENKNKTLEQDETVLITIPKEITDLLDGNSSVNMAFAIFTETTLFPVRSDSGTDDIKATTSSIVGSQIVSAIVAGVTDGTLLSAPVIMSLKLTNIPPLGPNENITSRTCVYWDFNAAGQRGNWSSRGCNTTAYSSDSNVVTCQCDHLTNFACLVDISIRTNPGPSNTTLPASYVLILEITSYTGIIMSLMGLTLVIVTHLIFKKIRQKDATKLHVQLSVALMCMLVVFAVGINRTENTVGCVTVGVLLHYFLLSAWMWMGAESLLLFQKLVLVFLRTTRRYFFIISATCWVAPLIPVISSVAVNPNFYITPANNKTGAPGFCFIGHIGVFFGAFLGPMLIIALINSCIFITVVGVLIRHLLNRSKDKMTETRFPITPREACKLTMSLSGITVLLGLTWSLSIFTLVGVDINRDAAFSLQWLFVFANSFQGFFVFVFLVLLSADTRNAWIDLFCKTRKVMSKSQLLHSTKSEKSSTLKQIHGEQSSCSMTQNPCYELVAVNNNSMKREESANNEYATVTYNRN